MYWQGPLQVLHASLLISFHRLRPALIDFQSLSDPLACGWECRPKPLPNFRHTQRRWRNLRLKLSSQPHFRHRQPDFRFA